MRHPIFLSVMVCFVGAVPVFGQNYPAEAVVLQKEVEVRSGPGNGFYATSKLYQNDRVLVLREVKDQQGWLEIKPPDRSFSWISGKNIKQVDARHAYVDCDPSRPVSTSGDVHHSHASGEELLAGAGPASGGSADAGLDRVLYRACFLSSVLGRALPS